MEAKKATCPDCNVPLHEVTARARSGYLIVLDQCERCGGIWCDRWELFPLSLQEAHRVDALDTNRLLESLRPPRRDDPTSCPRCPVELRPFRDPHLPVDADIRRCPLCDGMWLNRGSLRTVKAAENRPPAQRSEDVDALLRIYKDQTSPTWARVENLDNAVNPPLVENDPEAVRKEVLASSGWVILNFLLRLLLRA